MSRFTHLRVGVPVRQTIKFEHNEKDYDLDNLYLVKLQEVFVDSCTKEVQNKCQLHLFTTKELIVSTERYYRDLDIVISNQPGALTGHTYPITYNNRNNVPTTRFFCKFNGTLVEGLGDEICCGLFTSREMNRSRERVVMYLVGRTVFRRIMKGAKCLLHRLIQKVKRYW